jgi:hypothetical protein
VSAEKPFRDADEFARALERERDRLAPRFPDMDPGDLLLILECLMRPREWGRHFLLREIRPGVYAP